MRILLLLLISFNCMARLSPAQINAIKIEDVKHDLTGIINPEMYCNTKYDSAGENPEPYCLVSGLAADIPSLVEYDAALVIYKKERMKVYGKINEVKIMKKGILRKLRKGSITNVERDILLRWIIKKIK